jgi:uridine kinase
MTTRLILVEGLPGSGKSTTAKKINDILIENGYNVELYLEGNYDHPADYEGVAYFNIEDYNRLMKAHSSSINSLNKIKSEYHNGYVIPYRKAIDEYGMSFNSDLFNEIVKNDIYELPIELHMELILRKWNDFVNNYLNDDKIIIFECCFIQNPVTVTMVKNNLLKESIMRFIHSLAKIILPLGPILIYVEQNSIEESFTRAINERPKEWIEGFTDYYTNQGYGLYNNYTGLGGVMEILKARSNLDCEIYDSLNIVKYKVDNSAFNYELLQHRIHTILKGQIINYW